MPYTSFEPCTVQAGDRRVRGARIACGYCPTVEEIGTNTFSRGGGNDDAQVERHVRHKFEARGWQVAKNSAKHACPKCLSKFKAQSMSKKRENDATANVVPIIATVPPVDPVRGEQQMTPVERRIILEKLNTVYVNETVGYSEGWNDQRVADDQGVPRIWVAEVRDLLCGPDIGTESVKQLDEARAVAAEIKTMIGNLQPFIDQMQALQALTNKADIIMSTLVRIEDKKT